MDRRIGIALTIFGAVVIGLVLVIGRGFTTFQPQVVQSPPEAATPKPAAIVLLPSPRPAGSLEVERSLRDYISHVIHTSASDGVQTTLEIRTKMFFGTEIDENSFRVIRSEVGEGVDPSTLRRLPAAIVVAEWKTINRGKAEISKLSMGHAALLDKDFDVMRNVRYWTYTPQFDYETTQWKAEVLWVNK